MTATSGDVHSALSGTLKEMNNELLRQKEFAIAVQAFQQNVSRDLDHSRNEVSSYLAKFVGRMDEITQSLVNRLLTAVKGAETDIAGLNEVYSGTGY